MRIVRQLVLQHATVRIFVPIHAGVATIAYLGFDIAIDLDGTIVVASTI